VGTTSLNLKGTSFEWAKAHFKKFGSSDVFPPLFELEAVDHSWDPLKKLLEAIDLRGYLPASGF
jgi:hypothetical protein